ncbi:MAG: DUF1236 domain-containing protein, partial [Hyphomicrobiales bacterium]
MRAKSILAGASALAAVIAAPSMAMALDAVAVTDLNMRAGPGSQYPIVTTIESNGAVEILGCLEDAQWCQVNWQGNQGWSYSEYLAVTETGEQIYVPQARSVLDIPIVAFEGAANVAGAAVTGAADVVGSILGGVSSLASAAVTPPGHVRSYVVDNRYDPVLLEGEVVVGAALPDVVELRPVPDYEYHYAYVNGVPVLVDPS